MRRFFLALVAGLIVGLAVPAHAEPTWWQPGTEPLPLHWNLGGAINVDNPRHVGERSISGAVLPRPAVLDIDGEFNTAATVATLHGRGQRVICYIDAGVYEDYRSDAGSFPPEVIGAKDGAWDGSWWLDIRRLDILLPIMEARIRDWCAAKGFDAVEPDEIDGWENASGFPLTYDDQVAYNRAIADLIHKHGMAAIQKGDIIQTRDLVDWFDATLNEECYRYRECSAPWNPETGQEQIGLHAYTQQGKAVWVAEYTTNATTRMCADAPARHWNAARYKLGLPLGGGRNPCAGW
jgi:endo-alpha-1,4-polygalactosaminidase (GH114 family)